VNYTLKDNYLESFQGKYHEFVEENSLPEKKSDKVLIKYFATVENILEKPVSRIPSDKHYIWTKDHVKNYMSGKTAFIWVLKVYKLKNPYWAEPTPGAIRYANLKNEVSLENMGSVLSEEEHKTIIRGI
jgi:restriction system protein